MLSTLFHIPARLTLGAWSVPLFGWGLALAIWAVWAVVAVGRSVATADYVTGSGSRNANQRLLIAHCRLPAADSGLSNAKIRFRIRCH